MSIGHFLLGSSQSLPHNIDVVEPFSKKQLEEPRARLRRAIEDHPDYNFATLSKAIGMSHAYIQQYLGAKASPKKLDADIRELIARKLGNISADDLRPQTTSGLMPEKKIEGPMKDPDLFLAATKALRQLFDDSGASVNDQILFRTASNVYNHIVTDPTMSADPFKHLPSVVAGYQRRLEDAIRDLTG